jgi:hypothetical protein
MKVSTENDNNFGYEKITIVVDIIPLRQVWLYIKLKSVKFTISVSLLDIELLLDHTIFLGLVWFVVLNATFINISVISWQSVLLMEETGVPRENHWPYHIILHRVHIAWVGFALTTLVVIGTECIGNHKPKLPYYIFRYKQQKYNILQQQFLSTFFWLLQGCPFPFKISKTYSIWVSTIYIIHDRCITMTY